MAAPKNYVNIRQQWNIDHGYPVDAPAGYGSTGGPGLLSDVSRVVTNIVAPVAKPIEQAATSVVSDVSAGLADIDKNLSLSQNAPLIAAIALSVAAPGVGSAIGQQMIAAGLLPAATSAAVASAIGASVANAALSVAQGQTPEEAL
jgi:hypothetical protein